MADLWEDELGNNDKMHFIFFIIENKIKIFLLIFKFGHN